MIYLTITAKFVLQFLVMLVSKTKLKGMQFLQSSQIHVSTKNEW